VRRRTALACLATIGVADYVLHRRPPRWIVAGMFDHPAHVATAMLLRRDWPPTYLAGSLLPDLDHVPLALRAVHPAPDDPRPVTHSLLTVPPVAAVNRHAAAGMLAHFVRDLGVGTGVPLLWPLTHRRLRVPYVAYAVLLLATAYSRSRPSRAAPAHNPGASGRGP
jgi:LexA-binding, inner membrane-associated putative hydrolase